MRLEDHFSAAALETLRWRGATRLERQSLMSRMVTGAREALAFADDPHGSCLLPRVDGGCTDIAGRNEEGGLAVFLAPGDPLASPLCAIELRPGEPLTIEEAHVFLGRAPVRFDHKRDAGALGARVGTSPEHYVEAALWDRVGLLEPELRLGWDGGAEHTLHIGGVGEVALDRARLFPLVTCVTAFRPS